MAKGKNTCRILKEIRRQIAEANGIDLVISECRYKGDCLGTCPKCETEVRYLEEQLHRRRAAGQAVVLAGLSAGLLALSSCAGRGQSPAEAVDADSALRGEPVVMADTIQPTDTISEEGELPELDDSVATVTKQPAVPERQEQRVTELMIVGYVDDELEEMERRTREEISDSIQNEED